MRTRVKVCGMTRIEDVNAAVNLGVDAIGMILYADSPRVISLELATTLRSLVPAFVNVVGVFVDAEQQMVEHYCKQIGLDTVQLHGSETPEYAASLNRPYIKALRVQSSQQVVHASKSYSGAISLLLDPYVAGKHGGTGALLPADHWPKERIGMPLILAGGLSPDNVGQRISDLVPYGVDVNSGIESKVGEKDVKLLAAVLEQVRESDAA